MLKEIKLASTELEIANCFAVFSELRPHLIQDQFVAQIIRQQIAGYQIAYLAKNQQVSCAAGFRINEFLAWGKILYIDDLITAVAARGQGLAGKMLDWLIAQAKLNHCNEVHLDTGYNRHNAHRLYLSRKMIFSSHHVSLPL